MDPSNRRTYVSNIRGSQCWSRDLSPHLSPLYSMIWKMLGQTGNFRASKQVSVHLCGRQTLGGRGVGGEGEEGLEAVSCISPETTHISTGHTFICRQAGPKRRQWGLQSHLDSIAFVYSKRGHDVCALDLNALGVDNLARGDHICKEQPCPLALVHGDRVHLSLHLSCRYFLKQVS